MRFAVVLLFLLADQSLQLYAQGSLVYVPFHRERLSDHWPYYVDLNGDGAWEIGIYPSSQVNAGLGPTSGSMTIEALLNDGTRMASDSPNLGMASIFEAGEEISAAAIPIRQDRFAPSNSLRNWIDSSHVWNSTLSYYAWDSNGATYSGGMYGTTEAIFGLQFVANHGYHNAWLRIELFEEPSGNSYYRVADWAYNTVPEAPILAGLVQVPEPSILAFLMLAGTGGLLAKLSRRRTRQEGMDSAPLPATVSERRT